MIRVFIGYDSREPIAYHVLAQSILRRATCPVSITPVALSALGRTYTRPRGPMESTEFSLTRFLVPWLSGYDGYSIFMDCDMLVKCDLMELLMCPLAYPTKAVHVVQHHYAPRSRFKMEGQVQTVYPCKNWSSLMVFNNALCTALSPAYVNEASALALHQFHWLDEGQVGSLPTEYNWLVGEYEHSAFAKILHFTRGGPWLPDYSHCDYAEEWRAERDRMLAPEGVMV